jgi:hypothetical protein
VAINDRRELEFDLLAVRLILQWSPRATQAFGLPPMTPRAVLCHPAEGTIEVAYGEPTPTTVFMLRSEALGAIILSYCRRVGIPMPRSADKSVRIKPEHVAVEFTLRMMEMPQPYKPEHPITRIPDQERVWSWAEPEN